VFKRPLPSSKAGVTLVTLPDATGTTSAGEVHRFPPRDVTTCQSALSSPNIPT
jgi:hypothetical protein